MDVVFQLILYRSVHPGAALVVGPLFICTLRDVPSLTTRVAQAMNHDIGKAAFLLDRNIGRREKR
jgi:hypothetical protein